MTLTVTSTVTPPPPILIYGPTASGKTGLAVRLAKRLGAEIINADSMQVYTDLRILSARPTPQDTEAVPHHLFGTVDGAGDWSVGAWLRAATPLLATDTPWICVGGTGLYFKALTEGLAEIPEIDPSLRQQVADQLADGGEEAVREELKAVDPEAEGRIAPHDHVRLIRALAVWRQTGRAISAYQADTKPLLKTYHGVVLNPPTDWLVARIEARFDQMLTDGVIEEVKAVAARGLPADAPMQVAHGLPHLLAHLAGELSLAEARALSIRDTRRYAKRQRTWARHQFPDWLWLETTDDAAREAAICDQFALSNSAAVR